MDRNKSRSKSVSTARSFYLPENASTADENDWSCKRDESARSHSTETQNSTSGVKAKKYDKFFILNEPPSDDENSCVELENSISAEKQQCKVVEMKINQLKNDGQNAIRDLTAQVETAKEEIKKSVKLGKKQKATILFGEPQKCIIIQANGKKIDPSSKIVIIL